MIHQINDRRDDPRHESVLESFVPVWNPLEMRLEQRHFQVVERVRQHVMREAVKHAPVPPTHEREVHRVHPKVVGHVQVVVRDHRRPHEKDCGDGSEVEIVPSCGADGRREHCEQNDVAVEVGNLHRAEIQFRQLGCNASLQRLVKAIVVERQQIIPRLGCVANIKLRQ